MTAPTTGTCRHCGTPVTRVNVAALWRDRDGDGSCPSDYYHQPEPNGADQ